MSIACYTDPCRSFMSRGVVKCSSQGPRRVAKLETECHVSCVACRVSRVARLESYVDCVDIEEKIKVRNGLAIGE